MTIIVRLSGGLGNQIFQYGAARALAIHHKTQLKIDLDWFNNIPIGSTPRYEMLSQLNINPQFVCSEGLPLELDEMKISPINKTLRKILGKKSIYREKTPFIYQTNFFEQNAPIYLDGYWQSYKYINPIRELLLKEISPNFPLHTKSLTFLNKIKACKNPIMLHIRRGDYVISATANHYHGVLPLTYYYNALERLMKLPSPELFVFSDDINWAKDKLVCTIPTTFIEGIPSITSVVEELYLMTHCHHHVIANSSLSWIGAWLSQVIQKQVFAPKQWLSVKPPPLHDLIPPNWHLI